jgi:hypothetical protein
LRRPADANDSGRVFFGLRVDDNDQSTVDRTDRNETVFELGVLAVEDLEVVVARLSKRS